MIYLSFSTLNDLVNEPHTWLCKQMGLQKRHTWQMQSGTDAHQVIQLHVSGEKNDDRLEKINATFPIVEHKKQDEATHFTFPINDEYGIHGYVDGLNPEQKSILEIKTSSKPWGLSQFYRLMQWRLYALGLPEMKSVFCITANRNLSQIKTYSFEINEQHRKEAMAWIQKGIDIIESGDFAYKDSRPSRYCGYINCPFCGGNK